MDLFGPSFFFPSEAFLALRTRFDFFFCARSQAPSGNQIKVGPLPRAPRPPPCPPLIYKIKLLHFIQSNLLA